jgi:tRNA pseudouridine38-40 synthase
MHRYFVELAYKGTNYHGWQIQPNANSVQEELNKAFSTILQEEINIVGCGRTDTGVHASFFVAHFDSKRADLEQWDKFIYKLNGFLPLDISIFKLYKVDKESSSRFDAKERSYKYYINQTKDPFTLDSSAYLYGELDVEKMNEAAKCLYEYKDFTSFSKLHTDAYTNNCDVKYAVWEQNGSNLIFTITANRFLRNMVRAIVGTLINVGNGKLSIEDFRNIIEAKDRGEAGFSVPAKGLFLVDIKY